jgi:hypothetical protein
MEETILRYIIGFVVILIVSFICCYLHNKLIEKSDRE